MGKKTRRKRLTAPTPSDTGVGRSGRARTLIVVALAGLVVGVGVFALKLRSPVGGVRPNILLITIDTLRADRLGCYGYAKASTPTLDALAARGVRFATAIAHVPLTTPSHASILTGLTPLRHGVRDNGAYSLPAGIPTVAEAFRTAGYRTGAVVSAFPLDRRFGLDRGFETYEDRLPHGDDPRRAPYVERKADATTALVLRWLEAAPEAGPWFAWVHYFDPHAPYEPPGDLMARTPTPYDGEVALVDAQIGILLRHLEGKGALDRTLVLVTADHGESLGQHGEETHGVFIYDATLKVPWIMAGPGLPRGRVAQTVARGIDVAPTLLEYAGLRSLPGAEGRSLRKAGRDSLPDEPVYIESLFTRLHLGWAGLHGWRSERWKLIEAPRPELYALDSDGDESKNLSGERPEVAAGLRRQLRAALTTTTPNASVAADPGTAERFGALGYIGGGGSPSPSGRDPKDGIDLINRLERGIAEARSNPALALQELTAVLTADPGMPLARRYRAIAHQVAGRYDEALADIRALEAQGAPSAEDALLLAETLRLARRHEEALAALDRASQAAPGLPEPWLIRARVLRAMGRAGEAGAEYERVLSMAPKHSEAERGLAELAIERGAFAEATPRLEAILRADPDDAGALVKLGVVRVRAGRLDEALALFQKAVARAPANAEALLDLAGVLAKSGRPAEAIPYFERAIRAGGATTVALNGLGFARLESGDSTGALRALRESLAREPRQAQVAEVVADLGRGTRR